MWSGCVHKGTAFGVMESEWGSCAHEKGLEQRPGGSVVNGRLASRRLRDVRRLSRKPDCIVSVTMTSREMHKNLYRDGYQSKRSFDRMTGVTFSKSPGAAPRGIPGRIETFVMAESYGVHLLYYAAFLPVL